MAWRCVQGLNKNVKGHILQSVTFLRPHRRTKVQLSDELRDRQSMLDDASKPLAQYLHSAGVGNRPRSKPLPCGPNDDEGDVSQKQSSLPGTKPPCPRL